MRALLFVSLLVRLTGVILALPIGRFQGVWLAEGML